MPPKIDDMLKIRDTLAAGICTFDIRIMDGMSPDAPCETLCEYCLAQATYLMDVLQKELANDK